jgi:hypothetical protein
VPPRFRALSNRDQATADNQHRDAVVTFFFDLGQTFKPYEGQSTKLISLVVTVVMDFVHAEDWSGPHPSTAPSSADQPLPPTSE